MAGFSITALEDVPDVMGDYPGEMRMLEAELGCHQVAFSWRRMPPDTGGRGSYGHRHRTQEEVYFVALGALTFKCGDDVFECGPGTAVRIAPETVRSVHNDSGDDVVLIMTSTTTDGPANEVEKVPDFWPS